MSVFDIAFYAFAAVIVVSAAIMVFSRNVIYSAVGLLFTLAAVAAVYVMLAADFVAIVQILVYVGGILILLLFGVMLSQRITGVDLKTETMQVLPAALVVSGVLFVLVRMLLQTDWNEHATNGYAATTKPLGELLMTTYLIPFEIISVLLLAALIGATFIARKEKT